MEYKTTYGKIIESTKPIEKGDVFILKHKGYMESVQVESVMDNVLELELYNIRVLTVKN